ncbi:MAG TPA: hypothetical protein VF783_08930, partial [Terriglobales bacterium]
ILNRGRKRAPNLRATERIIAGLCALFINPARVLRSIITSIERTPDAKGTRRRQAETPIVHEQISVVL